MSGACFVSRRAFFTHEMARDSRLVSGKGVFAHEIAIGFRFWGGEQPQTGGQAVRLGGMSGAKVSGGDCLTHLWRDGIWRGAGG